MLLANIQKIAKLTKNKNMQNLNMATMYTFWYKIRIFHIYIAHTCFHAFIHMHTYECTHLVVCVPKFYGHIRSISTGVVKYFILINFQPKSSPRITNWCRSLSWKLFFVKYLLLHKHTDPYIHVCVCTLERFKEHSTRFI